MRGRRSSSSALTLLVCAAAISLGAEPPITVSPGDTSGALLVESRCPTFSWSQIAGAESYEMVVYRLGRRGDEAQPIIRQVFPGSIGSWTPALGRCLTRGGSFAWAVRGKSGTAAPEWSAPSFFRVDPGPTKVQFEEALQVVREFLSNEAGAPAATDLPDSTSGENTPPEDGPSAPEPRDMIATQVTVEGGIEAGAFTGDGSALSSLDPSNLSAPVSVEQGGTGATSAAGARSSLDAAAEAHTHTESDISDLTHTTSLAWSAITSKPLGFDDDVDNDTVGGLSCSTHQIARYSGSVWECVDPTVPAIIYTRWGRSDCPSGTNKIYDGMAGGESYSYTGGGASYLCLPTNPEWGEYSDLNELGATVTGIKYFTAVSGVPTMVPLSGKAVPCAVCLREGARVAFMQPARTSCPPGFTLEYPGYLMASNSDHERTEYICVDSAATGIGPPATFSGAILYFTEAECTSGGLPCGPYVHRRELTCSVCSQ